MELLPWLLTRVPAAAAAEVHCLVLLLLLQRLRMLLV
jgi:hypothetical protein